MKVLGEILLYFVIMFMPCWIILASYGINSAIDAIKEKHLEEFDKCFEENIGEKGKCYGMYGGDKSTDNISYSCLDCPHLSILTEDELWDMCADKTKHDPVKIHYYIRKKGGGR